MSSNLHKHKTRDTYNHLDKHFDKIFFLSMSVRAYNMIKRQVKKFITLFH